MGSVEKRVRTMLVRDRKSGEKVPKEVERWYARYRTPDGRQRSQVFERERQARDFLTSMENAKLTGSYIDPSRGRVTVGALGRQWLDAQAGLAPPRRKGNSGSLKGNIERTGGTGPLTAVSHSI